MNKRWLERGLNRPRELGGYTVSSERRPHDSLVALDRGS